MRCSRIGHVSTAITKTELWEQQDCTLPRMVWKLCGDLIYNMEEKFIPQALEWIDYETLEVLKT